MAGKAAVPRAFFIILTASFVFAAASACRSSLPRQEGQGPALAKSLPASPPDFQAALKAADADLSTEEGKAYESKMRASAGAWLASEIARCTSQYRGTAFGPFTVLIRIGSAGRAEEVLTWPETHIADCLKPKFAAAEYPAPPRAPWWHRLDIRIKAKSREGPGGEPRSRWQAPAGIPYDGDLGVFVTAPDGWVLDSQSGVSQGTHCVMYPKGSSWRNAPEVIYVNIERFGVGATLERLILKDIAKFEKKYPGIKVEELEPIDLWSGGKAVVRGFSGEAYPNFECVAYAPYGNGAATYVLTCRTREGLERTMPLFRKMVARSYPVKLNFQGIRPPSL